MKMKTKGFVRSTQRFFVRTFEDGQDAYLVYNGDIGLGKPYPFIKL